MESILHKIQALLNKTENQGASPAEAAAAAVKVQELLQKYNLNLSEVLSYSPEQSEVQKVGAARVNFYQEWKVDLLHILAKYNFCQVIRFRKLNYMLAIGRKANVEVVVYLYHSLEQQLEAMNVRDWVIYNERYVNTRKKFNWAWFNGALNTIWERLDQQQKHFEATNKGSALVVANKALVENFVKEKFGEVPTYKDQKHTNFKGAYVLGVQAGRQATLNQVLGAVNSPRQIGG